MPVPTVMTLYRLGGMVGAVGFLDWVMLVAYFVLLVVIGVQTMRKVKSEEDFAVAGNRIIWPVFFGSLAASFLGGGASMGVAGKTFSDGYVYMFAFFGYAVSFLLVGLFVAPRLKRYAGAHTVGDIMHEHYGKPGRLLTGVLSILLCAGILGAQALAIGTVVNATLDLPQGPSIAVGMAVVVLYSSFGGAWAVIQTDMLQFVFLGVFIPVTLVLALREAGGPAEMVNSLPDAHLTFGGDYTLATFIGLFIAFLLGETLVPPYAQRTFSTPDSKHARRGFALTGVFAFLFYFVAATLGLVALVLYPDIEPDQAMPTLVTNLVPAGLMGLVVAALLAVVMSTASSYLNAAAVAFVKDVYQPLAPGGLSMRRKLTLERALTLLVGVLATGFALVVPSIVDALIYAYSFWAPTIVIPLLIAVLLGSRSRTAALAAIVSGAAATLIWLVWFQERTGLDPIVVGAGANLVAFVVAHTLTRSRNRETGDRGVTTAAGPS
ncbi:sodium:solute symporter [Streptomyces sp. WMMB 322]|uniref:sodium:solute symporter family protein n=1 Tax=Streptomyces sp. WMMB 322 TaxID=1286821 RepID=UPI000823B92D|nr:sodium:solute symporter family protein [Streptomyces sp. WMMB 322]SCK57511.1 solute:Na+ symporter, SSS family [Streptomyces sp. WMMB 322]